LSAARGDGGCTTSVTPAAGPDPLSIDIVAFDDEGGAAEVEVEAEADALAGCRAVPAAAAAFLAALLLSFVAARPAGPTSWKSPSGAAGDEEGDGSTGRVERARAGSDGAEPNVSLDDDEVGPPWDALVEAGPVTSVRLGDRLVVDDLRAEAEDWAGFVADEQVAGREGEVARFGDADG
jgi:hypothetical protein